MLMPTIAEYNYNGFRSAMEHSSVEGNTWPHWESLSEVEKYAWGIAATVVMGEMSNRAAQSFTGTFTPDRKEHEVRE